MNLGRNSSLVLILLSAAALQGATPDPGSLASSIGLWLFLPAAARPEGTPCDDQSPDEVCESAARQIEAASSHFDQLRLGVHLAWAIAPVVEPTTCSVPRLTSSELADRVAAPSPSSLCRFDC